MALGRDQSKVANILCGLATLGIGEPDSRYVKVVQDMFSSLAPRTSEGHRMALSFDENDPMCFLLDGQWYSYVNRNILTQPPLGV